MRGNDKTVGGFFKLPDDDLPFYSDPRERRARKKKKRRYTQADHRDLVLRALDH